MSLDIDDIFSPETIIKRIKILETRDDDVTIIKTYYKTIDIYGNMIV